MWMSAGGLPMMGATTLPTPPISILIGSRWLAAEGPVVTGVRRGSNGGLDEAGLVGGGDHGEGGCGGAGGRFMSSMRRSRWR